MRSASESLARMDYLTCERLCLEALAASRQAQAWPEYARILLPLQESRRQRRMIAADGAVRLGTTELMSKPAGWLDEHPACCIVLTRPHDESTARLLLETARDRGQYVEVMWADNPSDAPTWSLRSFAGPAVRCQLPEPPCPLQEKWTRDAQWFLLANEKLGDAAIESVTAPAGRVERVALLEACLDVITDHEKLHQRLWDAAKAMTGE